MNKKLKALIATGAVMASVTVITIAQPFRRGSDTLKQQGCVRVEWGIQNMDLADRLNLYRNLGGRAEVVVEPTGLYTIIVYPEGC